jgi:two-component system, NtrC family, response regulator GlrR
LASAKILLVDDDPSLLRLLSIRLQAFGHEVIAVDSAEKALGTLSADQPQLVITDLRMSGMDGIALFEAVQKMYPTLPVIILTAHGTIPDAVEATTRGVFGFLTKPYESSALLEQIGRALRVSGAGQDAGEHDARWREDITTRSPEMECLLNKAKLVALSDARACLVGPSGSGKELLARAIHRASLRHERPFVAVNCAAIPEQLLESELFGHVRGAFSGAVRDHQGLFQKADRGTLFLDEIGDMPLSLQAKLLRVLEENQVRPVGSTDPIPVDVRIVSATHRALESRIAEGLFREDLYYRISVVVLEVPPLSARREDILLLASQFLKRFAEKYGRPATAFAPEALDLLIGADWPGNVRQLQNVVEQTVTLCPTQVIPAAFVQEAMRLTLKDYTSFDAAKKDFERDYLTRLLRITEGNVSRAARLAQRHRTDFYKLLQRHQIDPSLFKKS